MAASSQNYYEFEGIGGQYNSYVFSTRSDLIYEIRFTPTPYLFGHQSPYSNHIFEFSILLLVNPTQKEPVYDALVSHTVAAVIEDFYKQNDQYIMIYICDSSDGRQMVRNRKFNSWFEYFSATDYLKIDKVITDADGERFPVSLIVKDSNPKLLDIFRDFTHLVDGYSKDE